MVSFQLWGASLKFALTYSIIILVPCVCVALMGKKMINELGRYPSKTPAIQMSVVWKFVIVEVITFSLLIAFYNVFSGMAGK